MPWPSVRDKSGTCARRCYGGCSPCSLTPATAGQYDHHGRARRGASGALYPQSARAGSNSRPRSCACRDCPHGRGADGWVLRGRSLRTPPGSEESNGKQSLLGAAGVPGPSRLMWISREASIKGGCTAGREISTGEPAWSPPSCFRRICVRRGSRGALFPTARP